MERSANGHPHERNPSGLQEETEDPPLLKDKEVNGWKKRIEAN